MVMPATWEPARPSHQASRSFATHGSNRNESAYALPRSAMISTTTGNRNPAGATPWLGTVTVTGPNGLGTLPCGSRRPDVHLIAALRLGSAKAGSFTGDMLASAPGGTLTNSKLFAGRPGLKPETVTFASGERHPHAYSCRDDSLCGPKKICRAERESGLHRGARHGLVPKGTLQISTVSSEAPTRRAGRASVYWP